MKVEETTRGRREWGKRKQGGIRERVMKGEHD
jgi:hypothetical protein